MGADIVFDPYSPTYFDDPYDLYRRMRDEAPVLHNEELGFYALSRWDDVVNGERDWATSRPASRSRSSAACSAFRPTCDSRCGCGSTRR